MSNRTARNLHSRDVKVGDWRGAVEAGAGLASPAATQTMASTLAAIGLRMRELRLSRGMTLKTLAAKTNLSPSMLSLVERSCASPSIGSLIVIAGALGVTLLDLIAHERASDDGVVVRESDQPAVETAKHVVCRPLREDRARGVSIRINEFAPNTTNAEKPVTHDGFEYAYLLEGTLTIEIENVSYELQPGDLISYSSRRRHRIWNRSNVKARALWFNISRD
jgi:transcriptional regulator with XRE-family HTH domain